MQKQAPTLGRLLTMTLFALSCFGLLLFLWLSFGGPTPLKPKGYRVTVAFPEAVQLGIEAEVRVAGVPVGKVRVKDIDEQGNRTIATLEIDNSYAPIATDARAILRQKTLLGETYVELTPGTANGDKLPEGGRLDESQVAKTTELDELFYAFDPTTRQAFRTWQQELAPAVAGRGQALNDAFGNLPEFAADADDVLEVLDGQEAAVRRLVRNTGVTFAALTENEAQLRNLIVNSGNVFEATAARNDDLAATFKIFPTFLDESKATFAKLETFARNTDPLIRDLEPVARDLKPTLRDVRVLAPHLERFFRNLSPLVDASVDGLPALRDTLDGLTPVLAQLQPFLEELNPILEYLEYYQSQVTDFFSNGAGALVDTVPTRTANEMGHYLRQWGPAGPESAAMHQNRWPTNRGNAYLGPAAGSGPEHAKNMTLPSFDCANTGRGEFVTNDPDDDPSCWVQAAPKVPAGNTRKYPHIERANYSK